MAQSTTYEWPVSDVEAVCVLQDKVGAGNLNLNGKLATSFSGQVSFIRAGFSRSVSITSTNNLSAVNFTISGAQNGALITEIIAGPNNNTVYSTKIYDVIASISVSGTVNGVKVGTGKTGFLPLISAGPTSSLSGIRGQNSYALSAIVANNHITYSVFQTLEEVADNAIPFSDQLTRFFSVLSGVADKEIYQSSNLTNYLLLQVTASTDPENDSLTLIYMK